MNLVYSILEADINFSEVSLSQENITVDNRVKSTLKLRSVQI
jgi:hypothetical protein